MFELDKATFGRFLTEQRKAMGYTQKELAEKLFVSDKAVSKWERALSMPDISLLIPLAEILEVSVTELLEGRRLDPASEMNANQVENLVKKALTLSEDTPEKRKALRRKNAAFFFGCTLLASLELLAGAWYMIKVSAIPLEALSILSIVPLLLEGLAFGFGIYFWLFMKTSLPSYYDENKISIYADGMFQLSLPGISFHNGNWPHIVKCLRLWSVLTMTAVPAVCLLLSLFTSRRWLFFALQMVVLSAFLTGLFLPVYIVGKKYGAADESGRGAAVPAGPKRKTAVILTVILLSSLLPLPFLLSAAGTASYSAVRISFSQHQTRQEWSASYKRLDGSMSKNIYPQSDAYLIEVTTSEGSLSMEFTDDSGNCVFSAQDMPSGVYETTLSGTTRVKITASDHRGGFSISPL